MKTMLAAGRFCKRRENQMQNRFLTREFEEYSENIFETNKLLEKFEVARELNRTGLLLKPSEARKRAQFLSEKLIDCNLIQNGLLVAGMLEHIREVANAR